MDADRQKDDLFALGDIPAAVGLLTRLPVQVDTARATARGARAAWAWPIAGLIVSAIAASAGALALWSGLTPLIAAALTIALQAILTGAMHEDGLADCADGLWGGWTADRRLEIMKDSRTGAYGVVALVLSLLLRTAALAALMATTGWLAALIALGALSRVPMAALQALLPAVRPGGLSARTGRPPSRTVLAAGGIALVAGIAGMGTLVMPVAFAIAMTCAVWGTIARAKIGGQTGDVLGAAQQLSEIAGLLVLVALTA